MPEITDLSSNDVKLIKMLANFDTSVFPKNIDNIKHLLNSRIMIILCEYFRENTMGTKSEWIEKFHKKGLSQVDGKAAISSLRRIGFEIK